MYQIIVIVQAELLQYLVNILYNNNIHNKIH